MVIPKVSYVAIRTNEYQNYEYGYSISERQQFVGEFTGKRNEQGMAEVAVKNKFLLGDEVEMMTPQGNIVFKIEKCSIVKMKMWKPHLAMATLSF